MTNSLPEMLVKRQTRVNNMQQLLVSADSLAADEKVELPAGCREAELLALPAPLWPLLGAREAEALGSTAQ